MISLLSNRMLIRFQVTLNGCLGLSGLELESNSISIDFNGYFLKRILISASLLGRLEIIEAT